MPNANSHIKKSKIVKELTPLFFDNLFLAYWACWVVIKLTRYIGFPIPLLNNWLTDFVYIPIVIHTVVVFANLYIQPIKSTGMSLFLIMILCLFISFIFEGVMPQITNFYVFDPFDIGMYFSGGFFYYFIHQPLGLKSLQPVLDRI